MSGPGGSKAPADRGHRFAVTTMLGKYVAWHFVNVCGAVGQRGSCILCADAIDYLTSHDAVPEKLARLLAHGPAPETSKGATDAADIPVP